MENNLSVVSGNNIADTTSGDSISLTTTTANAGQALGGSLGTANNNLVFDHNGYSTTNCWPYYSTTLSSYVAPMTVERAMNGYIVRSGYSAYIAKNEKELSKVLNQIFNPEQKKKGKK